MTSEEILALADQVGLGPKELAHLLGISVRTIRRGVKKDGTVDVLLRGFQAKLKDPAAALSMRALMIVAARGEGLKLLILRLVGAYVAMDRMRGS